MWCTPKMEVGMLNVAGPKELVLIPLQKKKPRKSVELSVRIKVLN